VLPEFLDPLGQRLRTPASARFQTNLNVRN
jgi:hypothetical protein